MSLNSYAYVLGNPLKYIDPSGLEAYRIGYVGSEVTTIQKALNVQNATPGVFDAATLQAVNNFKDKNGLGNTGVWFGMVGDETMAAITGGTYTPKNGVNTNDQIYIDKSRQTITNSSGDKYKNINGNGQVVESHHFDFRGITVGYGDYLRSGYTNLPDISWQEELISQIDSVNKWGAGATAIIPGTKVLFPFFAIGGLFTSGAGILMNGYQYLAGQGNPTQTFNSSVMGFAQGSTSPFVAEAFQPILDRITEMLIQFGSQYGR